MRRIVVLLWMIIIGSAIYAQSDSLERAILYQKTLTNEISNVDFSKMAMKWRQTIDDMKEYPQLPFDQNGNVHYSFIIDYTNLTKQVLFNQLLEWLSINYGLFPANLYSNAEDGKIIFKNNFIYNEVYICNYTGIITVKEAKMKVEFVNISFQLFAAGHYSGDSWVPDKMIEIGFKEIFPIILKKPAEWSFNLNLLKFTDDYFEETTDSLCNYIEEYELRNNF